MTATKDPLRQLLDLMVYAPIGLITIARRELPQLVATGRTRVDGQLKVARLVGKLAVSKGKRELDRRLDEIERSRRPAELEAPLAEPAALLPQVIVEAVAAELDETPEPAQSSALPIEGYDSLAASQVVLRLGSLTGAELDAVRHYESTHRNRRTVLGKISQLQAALGAWPMDPIVRPASAADVDELGRLEQAGRRSIANERGGKLRLQECPLVDWSEALGDEAIHVLVGTLDDVPLAYMVLHLTPLRQRGVITHVFVEEGARELGLGDTLVEHAIDIVRGAGLAGIESVALPGDRETKNLFERAGLTARKITVYKSLQ